MCKARPSPAGGPGPRFTPFRCVLHGTRGDEIREVGGLGLLSRQRAQRVVNRASPAVPVTYMLA